MVWTYTDSMLRVGWSKTVGANHQMAKVIDKGLGTKDDPGYSPGFIIGPVIVSRKSTKSGEQKSQPAKARAKQNEK
jgi:hypothetical protein